MPKDWWRKQENVTVKFLGQQGFILNRYIVYEVVTDVSISISPSKVCCAQVHMHSVVRRYLADTQNSPSYGIASYAGIPSV